MSEDTENWKLKKGSILEQVMIKNQNVIDSENLNSPFHTWMKWRKDNTYLDMKCNDIWDNIRRPEIVHNTLKEKNINVFNYTEFINANKTVISDLKQLVKNKPLGSAGDITINELVSKG